MPRRVVTVFGGSGFVGRRVVRRLAEAGCQVRVAVRYTQQATFLRNMGDVGQVVPVPVDFTNQDAVTAVLDGADAAINMVGTLYEYGARRSFRASHVEGPARIALAARDLNLSQVIHMSALGASARSASQYARSKAEGEELVQRAFPAATILRPSVLFGPEDRFFNRFASIGQLTGVLPVFDKEAFGLTLDGAFPKLVCMGTGGPSFQPAYVEDVAAAVMRILENPSHQGMIYELGGPARYTMKEIMELIMQVTHQKCWLLPIPFFWAKVHALYLQYLPDPLLTPDQVRMLQTDNVLTGTKPGFAALGITPTPAEIVLPTYLERHRDTAEREIARAFR